MTHEFEVQKFLRSGGTLNALTELYGIKHRRHEKYDNLVLLKYDQIASDFSQEIVRDCRGIVLDESANWGLVSLCLRKFHNYGEPLAHDIDWATAKIFTKEDGSLCQLFAYDGAWHCATTGTPDGSGDVNGFGIRFSELFWRTLGARKESLPPADCGVCFFFELTGPMNRVVVKHDAESLVLLGARSVRTGQELVLDDAYALLGGTVPKVQQHPFSSLEDVVAALDGMDAIKQEGFVVVDAKFNRLKLKCEQYLLLHRAKGGMSRRAIVDIVRKCETSEVCTYFPELLSQFEEVKTRFDATVSTLTGEYEAIKDIVTQKEFAFAAVKSRCPGALFNVRAKKADSIAAHLASVHLDNVIDLLGYKKGTVDAGPMVDQ